MNRKIYIDSILEHLLASNFTESLFLKCSNVYKILHDISDFYFRRFLAKYRKKQCCFINNIFRKFEIDVCFTPLARFRQKYTILNSDSITESVKSKNSIAWRKRGEVGRVVLACQSDEEETRTARAAAPV